MPQSVLWYISNDIIYIVELVIVHMRTRTVYCLCSIEKYEELCYNIEKAT